MGSAADQYLADAGMSLDVLEDRGEVVFDDKKYRVFLVEVASAFGPGLVISVYKQRAAVGGSPADTPGAVVLSLMETAYETADTSLEDWVNQAWPGPVSEAEEEYRQAEENLQGFVTMFGGLPNVENAINGLKKG